MKVRCDALIHYTLRIEGVNHERYIICTIVFLLLFFGSTAIIAGENHDIAFGKFMIPTNERWEKLPFKPEFPDEYSYIEVLLLELPDKTVMYYLDKNWEASLIAFEYGQEQILWNAHTPYPSGQMPDPILVAGLFNTDQMPDILFCHSKDLGIGRYAEHWEQNMYLFFDGQKVVNNSIPLSFVDMSFGLQPEDCAQPGDCWENRRNSLLLILPAWGVKLTKSALENLWDGGVPEHIVEQLHVLEEQIFADEDAFLAAVETLIGEDSTMTYKELILQHVEPEPCTIAVWSRLEQSGEVSYHITLYQVSGQQIVLIENIDGHYDDTSEILHTVIQKRQEQEEAPEPILLNFLKNAPDYLCDEEDWFRYLEEWE
jgi:hypothetical protein